MPGDGSARSGAETWSTCSSKVAKRLTLMEKMELRAHLNCSCSSMIRCRSFLSSRATVDQGGVTRSTSWDSRTLGRSTRLRV